MNTQCEVFDQVLIWKCIEEWLVYATLRAAAAGQDLVFTKTGVAARWCRFSFETLV